ncbi:MAG: glycosyltransferase family 87 protein [Promethearchaeota archaeon]
MGLEKINLDNYINDERPFYKLFLIVIIIITVSLMIIRVVYAVIDTIFPSEYFTNILLRELFNGKDVDFRVLRDWMTKGFFGMYSPQFDYGCGHYYLYHWYFIFLPFYLIPLWPSYFIWDILRVFSTIYITYRFYEITKDKKECVLFLVFCAIGYAVDMYYNNTNWLILFLLGESYIQLDKDRKILAGILFTIATYKIYVVIFPLILLISKKIKLKELLYYIVPFGILIMPYFIYPNWLFQILYNWNYSVEPNVSEFLKVVNALLKLFEPAQLMFVSFMVLLLVLNFNKNIIHSEKGRKRFLIFTIIGETILFMTYLIFLGIFSI